MGCFYFLVCVKLWAVVTHHVFACVVAEIGRRHRIGVFWRRFRGSYQVWLLPRAVTSRSVSFIPPSIPHIHPILDCLRDDSQTWSFSPLTCLWWWRWKRGRKSRMAACSSRRCCLFSRSLTHSVCLSHIHIRMFFLYLLHGFSRVVLHALMSTCFSLLPVCSFS